MYFLPNFFSILTKNSIFYRKLDLASILFYLNITHIMENVMLFHLIPKSSLYHKYFFSYGNYCDFLPMTIYRGMSQDENLHRWNENYLPHDLGSFVAGVFLEDTPGSGWKKDEQFRESDVMRSSYDVEDLCPCTRVESEPEGQHPDWQGRRKHGQAQSGIS